MKDEDWNLLDRQALGVIRLTLPRNVAFNIAKEKTTVGLMKALSNMYEKPSASNKVHLMRRLFNLWMTEGASVAQHLNELNSVTTQLSSVEIEFDDEVRALILLSSLSDSWNATVTTVSSSSGSNKLKFDDVRDLVLSEEIRRRESGESSTSSVLHMESKGRNSTKKNDRGDQTIVGRVVQLQSQWVMKILMWHQRLGHMSEKGIKIMHSNGKLLGLQSVEIDMCEECILGKQKRVSFQTTGRTPKKERLELIHSDVWGPATTSSIGGKYYFVTFIDDHSRKVFVYFIKHKYEVFEFFKRWKAMVENETGLEIKKFRTDNGGEYEDNTFKKNFYDHGIRLERTVPDTPQHNGVAERMNRTLIEKARSIRIQSGLPK
ncbi:hypothetical protein LIER_28878 [Lithospermum erythrorhizon]|uniref:Integrase catalytic domain-containing protein n=1 Tax=Lithospermum erythrorhizon TaxID=34254 RepID=A0AAV3RHN1_LITER